MCSSIMCESNIKKETVEFFIKTWTYYTYFPIAWTSQLFQDMNTKDSFVYWMS